MSNVERLWTQSDTAARRGDKAGVRSALEELIRIEPRQAVALNRLGMIALEDARFADAEAMFLRAVEIDRQAPELWMNVATARRRRADDAGERDALLRVLDLDQRHIGGLLRLAELHERREEVPQAMLRWSALLELARGISDPAPAFAERLRHGSVYVAKQGERHAAAIDAALAPIRDTLGARSTRRFDACVDHMLGRRPIYRNECHGLHFPFLPADEFFDRDLFPWMPKLEFRFPEIKAEAEQLLSESFGGIEPYVSMQPGSPETKWTPLDNSLNWSVFYLWRFGQRDEAHCRRCPRTTAALEEIVPLARMPNRTPNVFFSILKPHTRLPAHTGVSNTRAIIHLPLIVPPKCAFRVGGETRQWQEGEAFAFDDTIDHEAWNDSDHPRVVLIFDVWNPHLTSEERELLPRYFELVDAHGFGASGGTAVSD